MFTEEAIHNAMADLGELTQEQIDLLKEALSKKPLNTEELRRQLDIDREAFDNFLITLEQNKKKNVFESEVSSEELEAVSGGKVWCNKTVHLTCTWAHVDLAYPDNCKVSDRRNIYGGNGFPNCAATVNDGSHCDENDACYSYAIDYQNMRECHKAWK